MRIDLPQLGDLPHLPFDTVIDVRAPAEFAEDHMPNAINLPVLDDAERAEVGTIYKQVAPFQARKVGGALVAKNIARHLQGPLANKPGDWQPLIYCWRGGQRSGAFGLWLAEVGWRVKVVKGGYQTYRRAVVAQLYDAPLPHRIVLLDGNTGTAKTDLLALAAERGVQVLDLEALANHRGSVLGGRSGGQPSQKMFESRLSASLAAMDADHPILVEAESSKVGDRIIPPSLWQAMRRAPRIQLTADPADRARYLTRTYADLFADLPLFKQQLTLLIAQQGHARVARWHEMADAGAFEPLVRELIDLHYDGRYANARAQRHATARQLSVALDIEGLHRAADTLAELVPEVARQAVVTSPGTAPV